jgi:hypothetical protein
MRVNQPITNTNTMETTFTTLTTAPLAALVDRLYEEADAESPFPRGR